LVPKRFRILVPAESKNLKSTCFGGKKSPEKSQGNQISCLTVSIERATPSKSSQSINSNFLVQILIQPKAQFECVTRDTEKSEFLDLVDFGNVAVSVETVIFQWKHDSFH